MKQALTEKEKRMYDYIAEKITSVGYPPSVRDICRDLGIKSTSTVHAYLSRLDEKGYIMKENGKSRSLRLEGERSRYGKAIRVPLIGRVTAGVPIYAETNFEGYVEYSPNGRITNPEDYFALNVVGTSMIDAGIMDGDIVIVEKTEFAENGDIIVALIGDEATVKTFYKENGHYRLQPENKTMEPIITDELLVLGRVAASIRYYNQ